MFHEYLHAIYEVEDRMNRIEAQIHEEVLQSEHAPVFQALQTLRSVAEVTAVTLGAENGQFSRFFNPRQLMSYAGLVPKEYSSRSSRWQGSITKTGNSQIRHAPLVRGSSVTDGVKCGTQPTHINLYTTVNAFAFEPSF